MITVVGEKVTSEHKKAVKRAYYAANKAKIRAQKKASRDKSIEQYRDKEKKRKKKARDENKEETNEYQRKKYAENREENAKKINNARIKREPYRGLKQFADQCSRGDKSISELTRLVDERIALSNKRNGEDSGS